MGLVTHLLTVLWATGLPNGPLDGSESQAVEQAAKATAPQSLQPTLPWQFCVPAWAGLPQEFHGAKPVRQPHDFIKDCYECDDAEPARKHFLRAHSYRNDGEAVVLTIERINIQIEKAGVVQRLDDLKRLKTEQGLLLVKAEKNFQQALEHYLEALKFRNNPLPDLTLLELGNLYFFDIHKPDLAVEQYQRLSREAKDPRYIPLAYFLLGEIRSGESNWRWAEQLYDASAKLDPTSTIPCTVYKKAWVQYRQGHPYLARKTFKKCEELQDDPNRTERVRNACLADAKRLDPLAR
jgi:tetratricopeptide (TPR) repeat protein